LQANYSLQIIFFDSSEIKNELFYMRKWNKPVEIIILQVENAT